MNAGSIIALWPSAADFAADVAVAVNTVYVWRNRGRVPARAVPVIYAAARRRGLPLSIDAAGRITLDADTSASSPREPTVSAAPSESAA